jgi:cardiolipin synthase
MWYDRYTGWLAEIWQRRWRIGCWCFGVMFVLQAIIIAFLSVVSLVRRRRAPQVSFPHRGAFPEVPVEGNYLQIYDYGETLYQDMLAAIEDAQESIFLETYLWKGDSTGQAFKDALIRKARAGVAVYAIFDSFGNLVVPRRFKRFPPEVQVLEYGALRRPWHLLDPRRYALDHRKLLVVDGKIGFIGGYNIGALYATKWRDTHVRIRGPEAAALGREFIDFWNRYAPRRRHINRMLASGLRPRIDVIRNDSMQLIFPIRDTYISVIERAVQHVLITSAYFIPGRALLDALIDAVQRGVDVQVLVPWESNHVAADWVARSSFTRCLQNGVRIFGYQGAMLHAKTMTVDDIWSTVGSANLDRLSQVGNHEINLEVYDAAFARQLRELFELDKTNARELTWDEWVKRPWYTKASERILEPLRPVL